MSYAYYLRRHTLVLLSKSTFNTDWSLVVGMCCLQMGEAENAGRLQVPEIGFFFEKDSWRFGGGEWAQVIDAL